MKSKSFIFIFLLTILFKIFYQQHIIIPLDPDILEDDNDKGKKSKNKDLDKDDDLDSDKEIEKELGPIKKRRNKKEDEDMDQPIVETKEFKDSNHHIKITRIHYQRSKNLHGNSEAITPIQIMRIFDNRVNSIFEDIIRQSMGIKMLLNGLSMVDDEEEENEDITKNKSNDKNEKSIFNEFELENEEEEAKNKLENKNSTEKNEKVNKKVEKKEKNKNVKKFGKLTTNIENIKNKNKKKKKLSRRELIFSRVCKYIFYSIIIFTIYILVKKLLEVLEIIDPDNAVEFKIENDETSKLKKTTENKQN